MGKQVAVIGLGKFGVSLAVILHDAGYEVLGIDRSADLVESISSQITHAVRADATKEASLQRLGIQNFDVVAVCIGDSVEDSVMVTILLKKLGARYIVARADSELHGDILENIGANKIIFPERDTAMRTGPVLTIRDVTDFIPLDKGSGIVKLQAPAFFVGRTLADVGFSSAAKNQVVVLMIQRGKEGIVNPAIDEVISHIDVLILAGNNSDIEKIIETAQNFEENEKNKHTNGEK
jgi:trk system potassium uptake protein